MFEPKFQFHHVIMVWVSLKRPSHLSFFGYLNVGLEILAFPCNQFGAQEPGSNDEIVEFACTRFKSEFPIFDKVMKRQESS